MVHLRMDYSKIIDLVKTFQHIVREYLPINNDTIGDSGFYSYYDEESQQTHILVTLDTLLEIANLHFQKKFESFTITTNSEPITYVKGSKSSILVGLSSISEDDYDDEESDIFWSQTTFDGLPKNVGFCEKSV